jgi:hypothetical protein
MLTDHQLDTIRDWAEAGALLAQESLRASHAPDSGLEIRDLRCTSLLELPDHDPCFEGEDIAGVVARFNGTLAGTVLLAMAPQDALDWVRANGECEAPIDVFVELGGQIQNRIINAIGQGMGVAFDWDRARLQEGSVPEILFSTHAPSDTAVLSFGALVAAGDHLLPLYVYVMLEPKMLGGVFSH